MARRGKILVIRGGAIGDFVLTLPVLAALRGQFPDTRVEVLGYNNIAALARLGGLADDVRSIEARSLAGFFARNGPLDMTLQAYFASFAVIVSYLYDPDEIFRDNIERCSKAQFIAGPHRPGEGAGLHATATFLKPLERLAIFDADPTPRLTLQSSCSLLNSLALHPGSGSERKNWSEANWTELLGRLPQQVSAGLVLVGGEAEEGRVQRLASVPADRPIELALGLPLAELAQRLAACRAFVGHDSGITHLAAALGLPVLALWGESVEAVWRPLGPRVKLLHGGARLAGLTVEQVLREVRAMVHSPAQR
jgi:hypothetical protein